MNSSPEDFIGYMKERFDVDRSIWEGYQIRIGKQSVHLVSGCEAPANWEIEEEGFRVARKTTNSFKPTTRLIQWLNKHISKEAVEITCDQLELLLNRKTVALDNSDQELTRGFVAIFYRQQPLGCGFWTGEQLETKISKAQSREFPKKELLPS